MQKKAVKKKATKKKATKKMTAQKRGTARPARIQQTLTRPGHALRVVRGGAVKRARRAPAAPAAASFPQAAHGSARQKLLFDLIRARVAVHAAIQGLDPGRVEEPILPGRWSVRQHVLHLVSWDRGVHRSLEATLRGLSPVWADLEGAALDAYSDDGVAELGHLSWPDAVRRLHSERDQLMEALESIPDEPAEPWSPDHPFGAMLADLADNDRRRADEIKAWRTTRGA